MAKNYFKSYIWLLEMLQSRGNLTLAELQSLWRRSSVNDEGKELAPRTFANHVASIADIFGIPAAERWARIEPYADAFELTGDLGQPISAYSHGMKQKLAIIAAWIHDPKLVIMDEPFVGLDPKAAHLLKGMMRELCDAGGAIFFSTHVLEVAEKLCDKVAIIKGGRLIRSGTMEEVKGDDSLEEVFLELEDASC